MTSLVNPTRDERFDQGYSDLSSDLDVRLVMPTGNVEEHHAPVPAFLQRLRQACVEDEFAQITSSVGRDPNIRASRSERFPRLQEVIIRGIRTDSRDRSHKCCRRCRAGEPFCRPRSQCGRQSLFLPDLLSICISQLPINISHPVVVSPCESLDRIIGSRRCQSNVNDQIGTLAIVNPSVVFENRGNGRSDSRVRYRDGRWVRVDRDLTGSWTSLRGQRRCFPWKDQRRW